jgi:hypothetical protein
MESLLFLLMAASPHEAAAPEQTVVVEGERPQPPPGAGVPVLRRDRWATVRVALDRRGIPLGCRVVASNLRRIEDRWRACHQIKLDFATREGAAEGLSLPATVERTLVVRSMKSRAAAGYRRVHIY